MRQASIFSGSSHPALTNAICDRLGQAPAKADLGAFSNGETKVQLNTHVRDQDVFIVQSGSRKINDSVMEMLVMIDACKGGSAKSITAVMPYFPYSRQSKKKSHRGAVTARMLANLLEVAGVSHVITIDLHSSQMQGFFKCPVDNLVAEPLIAKWIKHNVTDWKKAVVVSKNPGGTKRVTSLADALKLSFGIVMTERARHVSGYNSMATSVMFEHRATGKIEDQTSNGRSKMNGGENGAAGATRAMHSHQNSHHRTNHSNHIHNHVPPSPLGRLVNGETPEDGESHEDLARSMTGSTILHGLNEESGDDDDVDEPREVVTGRFRRGHIVDEDAEPSPSPPTASDTRRGSDDDMDPEQYRMMTSSFVSTASSVKTAFDVGLGGSADAGGSSDDEEDALQDPESEANVTLVGSVRNRTVLIVDDIIDKPGSWIAAAETVVKRGGATKVYCIATHGLFGKGCLEEMEKSDCIHKIVVTNSFPISQLDVALTAKLEILDVANLLSEAIRRNHHGESISQLFTHPD